MLARVEKVKAKTPNPIDMAVGGRIRMRRVMLGMSQTTLAEALGVTFQQVQKYEKGTNRVSASRLQDIATVLNVPVSFFFDGGQPDGGADDKDAAVRAFMLTSEGIKLNRAFAGIVDPKLRCKVLALVKAIAEPEA